jgi:DNA-binding response OmpR family regulator
MREGKHVVLYVEDDADYQDMVREILEAADFEMVAASARGTPRSPISSSST